MSSNQDKYGAGLKPTTASMSMREVGTSFSPGSLLNSLDETSVESGASAARKCITAANNSSAETLKSFFPKATRPLCSQIIDRWSYQMSDPCELVKPAATNTEELQSEVVSSQADALSVAIKRMATNIKRMALRMRVAVRLKACASMAPEDATELYGVPLKIFDNTFVVYGFVSNDKDDPEKTVVDWVGLRAYAAEQEAANATAAKNANLMTGMDGKSNYGHRFTR